LLSGLLDADCDEAKDYREQSDCWGTKDSVLTHRILPSIKTSQRKRGVERFGKTGVSLSVVKRSSLNSGASILGAKLCRKIVKANLVDDGRRTHFNTSGVSRNRFTAPR
jgi:hypothetical protein